MVVAVREQPNTHTSGRAHPALVGGCIDFMPEPMALSEESPEERRLVF